MNIRIANKNDIQDGIKEIITAVEQSVNLEHES